MIQPKGKDAELAARGRGKDGVGKVMQALFPGFEGVVHGRKQDVERRQGCRVAEIGLTNNISV